MILQLVDNTKILQTQDEEKNIVPANVKKKHVIKFQLHMKGNTGCMKKKINNIFELTCPIMHFLLPIYLRYLTGSS
jgi:hypothetical protein